jgi:hypothetical protein
LRERLALFLASLFAALVLALAAFARPDPRGYGTHSSAFGLPPCGFREWTGLPCATCGMTTAFAHAVRGHVLEAARAQPLGLLLALASAALAALGPPLAALAVPIAPLLRALFARRTAISFFALAILAWIYKIAAELRLFPL